MALLSNKTVGDENLEKWEHVGFGGFGYVYKARHKEWKFDVAIKIPRDPAGPVMSLSDEAAHMDQASCEFVLRRYGVYEGRPPGGTSTQHGIVMEFMGRGSVESLQKNLSGPPPWPLVFRLAHQVALGMNFLHSQKLMHQDLKPSNVLLTVDLNAKVADFGLCRVSTSALISNRETMQEVGGSYKYMPPEAFDLSYEPVRAFDVYSYGILLWSIITGKEPYPNANYTLVELKIPLGDRPCCKKIDQMKADGLEELVALMKRCWDGIPKKRPSFEACLEVTESVYSKHEEGIHGAVHEVSARLNSRTTNQHSSTSVAPSVALNASLQTPEQSESHDTVDFKRLTKTERSSVQDSVSVSTKTMSVEEKAKFVKDNRGELINNVTEVMSILDELRDMNMVHEEAYSDIKAIMTSREKMRELHERTLRSGGDVVRAAFYDALKKHHPQLVKRLGGSF